MIVENFFAFGIAHEVVSLELPVGVCTNVVGRVKLQIIEMGKSIIALAAVGGLHLLNRGTSFHLNCLIELVPARIWFLAC